MPNNTKPKDELPETFASYEEAGDFWDTHDSTDYLEYLIPVDVEVKLLRRHYEIEVEEEVMKALEHVALSEHISPATLANELLKKQLAVI